MLTIISENSKESVTENHVNGKSNGIKPAKEAESEESEESDSESHASEQNMNDIRLNESLNKVFEGQLDAENENVSDLDDEAMMEMDKHLAIAFKLRKTERKTDNSKIEYKLKALDLIQELFKTSYRLDLLNNLIKPMLNILFESQKKPNLKSISQRILGFLVSFKQNLKLVSYFLDSF